MCFTTLFALDPTEAWPQWEKVIKIQFVTFLTLLVMQSRERINWLVAVITASIGFFAVKGGVFALLTGGEYRVWGPPGSFIEGNNEIGLAIIMVIPFMNYLRNLSAKRWVRQLVLAVMIFSGLAVLATYSRGALLAGSAMTLFLILKAPRRRMFIVGALVVIPVLLAFLPEQWYQRMDTIAEYKQDPSALGRINAWNFAYNLASDHPLVGGGFEAFQPDLFQQYAPNPLDVHDAHSIYFQMLGEHGFVGLFLFLLLAWLAWRMASSTIRKCRDNPDLMWARQLSAMTQVGLIGYWVGGAFLGLGYFDLYYHMICIIVLTHAVVTRELVETAADVVPKQPSEQQGREIVAGSQGTL